MTASEPEPLPWTGLLRSARRWGALAWTEGRLSEILAAWAGEVDRAEDAVELAVRARRHASRRQQLVARLPELRELPISEVLRPVSSLPGTPGGDQPWDEVVSSLAGSEPEDGVELYRKVVLPALVRSYEACAAAASAVAEPAAQHTLDELARATTRELAS